MHVMFSILTTSLKSRTSVAFMYMYLQKEDFREGNVHSFYIYENLDFTSENSLSLTFIP